MLTEKYIRSPFSKCCLVLRGSLLAIDAIFVGSVIIVKACIYFTFWLHEEVSPLLQVHLEVFHSLCVICQHCQFWMFFVHGLWLRSRLKFKKSEHLPCCLHVPWRYAASYNDKPTHKRRHGVMLVQTVLDFRIASPPSGIATRWKPLGGGWVHPYFGATASIRTLRFTSFLGQPTIF